VTVGYLVDTDWIIDHFNGIVVVTDRFRQLRPEGLASGIVSLAELYEGVTMPRGRSFRRVAVE